MWSWKGGSYELSCLAGSGGIVYGEGVDCSTVGVSWDYYLYLQDPTHATNGEGDIRYVVSAGFSNIPNEHSGKTLTHTLFDGVDPSVALGSWSSIIPNDGDNNNFTIVDFIPDQCISVSNCPEVPAYGIGGDECTITD